jgi:hypothetical protein
MSEPTIDIHLISLPLIRNDKNNKESKEGYQYLVYITVGPLGVPSSLRDLYTFTFPSGIGIETCKEKVDIGKTAYLLYPGPKGPCRNRNLPVISSYHPFQGCVTTNSIC